MVSPALFPSTSCSSTGSALSPILDPALRSAPSSEASTIPLSATTEAEASHPSPLTQHQSSSSLHPTASTSLRGLMATQDIHPGDSVISVPMSLLAGYDYALASDFGRVLARIPTLSEEAAAVVWTMVRSGTWSSGLGLEAEKKWCREGGPAGERVLPTASHQRIQTP